MCYCSLYPTPASHFMILTGLVSVRISLNFIVLYTRNTAGILPNWDLKGLLYLLEFT